MVDTTEILNKLRCFMRQLPCGQLLNLSAYIIPSDDAHQSEYICQHDERRAFMSGFNGSAGTAVVTVDQALLWTDGRYYQQASKQLDFNWKLMKDGLPETPSIEKWLSSTLSKGSVVGVDPKLVSYRIWKPIYKELSEADCVLVPIEQNLVDLVWQDKQPPLMSKSVYPLDLKFCGATVDHKWSMVKKQMTEKNAEVLVISALDEVAWFLNLRGHDIDFNPVFFAYLIITYDNILLFIDGNKLPMTFNAHERINKVKVTIHDYDKVGGHLLNIINEKTGKIWISPTTSYYLTNLVPKRRRHQEVTPISINKAIKNEIEVQGFINCHIRDGVALCQYFAWLENAVVNGEYVDEISGAAKLEEYRSKQMYYKGLSFATISSSGPNGSIIHYHPTAETNRQINDKEIYLCDSGAQYLDGTTDVTRSLHFGEPTDFQKIAYTLVLKGQLIFGSTIFPNKIKGQVLDTLARKPLWDLGLDYGHGTGHGVGYFLNVHEGPIGVGIRVMPDDPGLQENMFISNEPGFYEDGEFGIRIEDVVQIVPAEVKHKFNSRGALTFKTITMCPKQTKMVKKELLSNKEIQLLNDYNKAVWDTISPILKKIRDEDTLSWLENETKNI